MRPRDRLETTPWRGDQPWPSLIKRVARAQQPEGTVPESWVAGLKECVRSGYLDQPEGILPLASPSLLRELAPSAMKEHGDRGFLGFGVFVAWCCDLRRGAVADFPEVDTRADQDLEVTILARCLDLAMTAPSWSRYTSPRVRRVLAERVSGRLVSEVPGQASAWRQRLAGSSEAAVTGCLSESVIKAHAIRVKSRRAVAQLWRKSGCRGTEPGTVDRVPAWLVAASAVRSPPVRFSTPVTARRLSGKQSPEFPVLFSLGEVL